MKFLILVLVNDGKMPRWRHQKKSALRGTRNSTADGGRDMHVLVDSVEGGESYKMQPVSSPNTRINQSLHSWFNMPRLSSYFLALVAAGSVAWADDSINRNRPKPGISPAFYCPEQVGKEKWECDNKCCGGENPSNKGHCALLVVQGKGDVKNQWTMNKDIFCECGPKQGYASNTVPKNKKDHTIRDWLTGLL